MSIHLCQRHVAKRLMTLTRVFPRKIQAVSWLCDVLKALIQPAYLPEEPFWLNFRIFKDSLSSWFFFRWKTLFVYFFCWALRLNEKKENENRSSLVKIGSTFDFFPPAIIVTIYNETNREPSNSKRSFFFDRNCKILSFNSFFTDTRQPGLNACTALLLFERVTNTHWPYLLSSMFHSYPTCSTYVCQFSILIK